MKISRLRIGIALCLSALLLTLGAMGARPMLVTYLHARERAAAEAKRIDTALAEVTAISQVMSPFTAQEKKRYMHAFDDGARETHDLISAGLFPADAYFGEFAFTPWGTSGDCNGMIREKCLTVTSQSQATANTQDAFAIEFQNIPPAACLALLQKVRDKNLIYANATLAAQDHALSLMRSPNILTGSPPSVTAATAQTVCGKAKTVSVQLGFKLKD